MSGSMERMASETRCLLLQKPRQFSCMIVIMLYVFLILVAVLVGRGEMGRAEGGGRVLVVVVVAVGGGVVAEPDGEETGV